MRSSAASDVYKRQCEEVVENRIKGVTGSDKGHHGSEENGGAYPGIFILFPGGTVFENVCIGTRTDDEELLEHEP